ncbi:MAG TPA: peptidoglycan editing factor PgeF [Gallionella sp.]|nr:MAG: hypothetical protein A2Z87_03185 [Gallionellales bacterium GWA2_54_124]HCI52000.1 peptidoglycan editing factor PgeF [Gallionella sp.]
MSRNLIDTVIIPAWPAPARVRAIQTTRLGGMGIAPYGTLNLGMHVGDDAQVVANNRLLLDLLLPSAPVWLKQVHGTVVADADGAVGIPVADASIARRSGAVCGVMTADCLPVLLCDVEGRVVAAVHAGWRGLSAGVIEAAVVKMGVAPDQLMAWLGPAISQSGFEVGDEVRAEFVAADPMAAAAFIAGKSGKYLADIYALARQRLNALGITKIYGGDRCTYSEPERFFSYRRDGVTGRQGSFIWLE